MPCFNTNFLLAIICTNTLFQLKFSFCNSLHLFPIFFYIKLKKLHVQVNLSSNGGFADIFPSQVTVEESDRYDANGEGGCSQVEVKSSWP